MRIDVTAKGTGVPDDVRALCEEKGSKLNRYFDRIQQITYRIEKHDDRRYEVECIVDVELHDDFVGKSEAERISVAVDESTSKAQRQLVSFKEKLKSEHR